MSQELTQADKERGVQACTNLLKYQCKDKILDRVNTCDEKRIENEFQISSRPEFCVACSFKACVCVCEGGGVAIKA